MRTWGELSKKEKLEIYEAYIDGKQIESYCLVYKNDELVYDWCNTHLKLFKDDISVRVKGEKK